MSFTTHGIPIMEATKRAKLQPVPFQLSLRIRHPSMDPEVISRELRIEPEHSFQAGQLRQLRSSGAPAVHTQSYWLAALNPAAWFENLSFPEPVAFATTQKHIDAAVARNLTWALSLCAVRLSKLHGSLLQQIRSEGGEISLLVTLSPTAASSFNLAPEVSRICGELGITLEFEMTND
jgi:hypothetical protein